MQNALSECVRVGGEAISLENSNRNYEAYRKYLFCCIQAFRALSVEVNEMQNQNYHTRLRLAKTASQCAERIVSFCEKPDVKYIRGAIPVRRDLHSPSSSTSPTAPRGPVRPLTTGDIDENDPEALARLQNQLMLEYHKKRMETTNYSAARKANLMLDLHKKMLEKTEMARKKKSALDHQLFERQKKLKEVADKRIAALRLSDPAKKKQHNDLLTAIFLHDDQHKKFAALKSGLLQDGELDSENAGQLCDNILSSDTHPLAVLMKERQQKVTDLTVPLQTEYQQLITDCVRVPYIASKTDEGASSTQNIPVEDVVDETSLADESELDDAFERNCNIAADQVKAALYKTDKEIGKLLVNERSVEPDSLNSSEVVNEDDEMDSLFESDDDDNINDFDQSPSSASPQEADMSEKPDNRVVAASEVNQKALAELLEKVQEFKEKLTSVNQLLHEAMHLLKTLLMLAYDDLNCTLGCDIITSAIHKHLFPAISDSLQLLYRLAHADKEKQMAQVMTKYGGQDISCMQVNEKWYLDTRGECYLHLSQKLTTIVGISSPLEKMSCAVNINQGVMETTSEYYRPRQIDSVMGADDLLPIICYIVLKAEMPHILSQCAIMEEFIPAEYMMEQEGYALSTVLMAVQYLLTL